MRPFRPLLVVVFGLALVTGGCALAPIPGPAPLVYRDDVFTDVARTDAIPYRSAVDQTGATVDLAFDLYEPAGDDRTARPLVIWVHGGSFAFGSRTSPELVDQATVLAKKGYVGASISYRLAPSGCTTPSAECVQAILHAREDAQAAVRFFRAHAAQYRIDPDRIAIAGTSAGAITALQVAYFGETPGPGADPEQSSRVRAAVSLSGAAILDGGIDPGDVPALLFHGTADTTVPYSWATRTVDAARADGLQAYLVTWEGDRHVPYVAHRTEILDLTTRFLYRALAPSA